MWESKLVISFSPTPNRGTTHPPPGIHCQVLSFGTQWSSFWYTWKESENKQRIFCLKMYFTLPEALQFRVWHILVLFTHKMLSSSLLLVCLIPDVTFLKLYFNWLFNIYLSPVQKGNCQKCRYLNSKYSIKINAVWLSSQDTFSKQQRTDFPYEAKPTWFFHVCFIK